MAIILNKTAFNNGEITPRLHVRTDIEKYDQSCRTLKNFMVMVYGGVSRRPGTEYISDLSDETKKGQLIPFNFSTDVSYVIELGEKSARFWNAAQAVAASGVPWTSKLGELDSRSGYDWNWDFFNPQAIDDKDWVTLDAVDKDNPLVGQEDHRYAFEAKSTHTSSSTNRPLTGQDWQDYWTQQTVDNKKNAIVTFSGKLYRSLVDHHSQASTNDPTETSPVQTDIGGPFWKEISDGLLELVTPWLEDEIRDVQYTQVNDLVYLAHPGHPPQKLVRISNTDWTLDPIAFDKDNVPPFLEENTDKDFTLNPTSSSGIVTIASAKPLFTDDMLNSYVKFTEFLESESVELDMSANGSSPAMDVDGPFAVFTTDNWAGTVKVEQSTDGDATFVSIVEYTHSDGVNGRQVSATGKTDEAVRLRLTLEDRSAGSLDSNLSREGVDSFGFVQITAINSASGATATVVKTLPSQDANYRWSHGAWSDLKGFPRAVCFHENRLWFFGTSSEPQRVWGSETDSYENFGNLGDLDTDPIDVRLTGSEHNAIESAISSKAGLVVLTAGGEWAVNADSEDGVITPTNIRARRHSRFGSDNVQAVGSSDTVIHVSRLKRKIFEPGLLGISIRYPRIVTRDGLLIPGLLQAAPYTETRSNDS